MSEERTEISRKRPHGDDEEEMKVKEFDKRMASKDKSRTKLHVSSFTDEKRNRALLAKNSEKEMITEELRKKSRYEYLNKRREDKLEDLEQELNDEVIYFKNEKLTNREKEDMETKKLLLKVAKLQQEGIKSSKEQYYTMPSNESTILNDYGEEKKKDRSKRGGLNEWEARQLKTGFCGKQKAKPSDMEYRILVDEFISFADGGSLVGMELEANELKEKQQLKAVEERDMTIEEIRKSLPIYRLKNDLIDVVKQHQVIVIEGETGSGKTTQIPQYLYEEGFCENNMKIGCTQPRRVAAMSVSARVAQEMNVKLGDKVGYSVRFEMRISDDTLIKYMTDGMLLREFLIDPMMSTYSVLIIDEAHERTLQTDVIFGLLREIMEERSDLKVIISSATCDTEKFSKYFDAPIFKIPGRRFPVETYYTKEQEPDYVDAAVVTVFQIHLTQDEGDVLVFLTGQEEIEKAMDEIQDRIKALGNKIKELIVLPIYSSLPSEKQAKIFLPTPCGARKVVLATNIAETSLTIDGIKFVVDCGYCKQKRFDSKSRMDALEVIPISRASAIQRAGRAGRVAPGKCFRLYKKCTFDEEFEDQPIPEIQRTNISNVVLLLKHLGIDDIMDFQFLDRPGERSIFAALSELYFLGAINPQSALSLVGRKMVEIPCDPMISKMILSSEKYGCSEEIITIAAMLSLDNTIFYTPKDKKLFASQAHRAFLHEDGDHLTLLNVYNTYAQSEFSSEWCKENYIQSRSMKMARNIRDQLIGLADRLEVKLISNPDNVLNIRKAITAGFFINTAKFSGDCYRRIKTKDCVYMHPTCVFKIFEDYPRYLVYNTVVETEKEFMRTCLRIDPRWLTEVAPHVYRDSDFDGDKKFKKSSKN